MVFSHSDAIQIVVPVEDKGYFEKEQDLQNAKKRKKFEWKPYHLLLVIYGLIVLVGIVFNITS